MKYRLNKAETVSITLYQVAVTKTINGKEIVTYNNYLPLSPGKVYETKDEAMINWLKAYKRKVRYTSQLESALKANDVPYEVELCSSCGGKIRKISYHVIEVFE